MARRTAPREPGSRKNRVWAQSAALARDWIVLIPISARLRLRKSSPKPGMALLTSGSRASGVTSRAVIPVPPVEITT
jgi:hypothetical protein